MRKEEKHYQTQGKWEKELVCRGNTMSLVFTHAKFVVPKNSRLTYSTEFLDRCSPGPCTMAGAKPTLEIEHTIAAFVTSNKQVNKYII